MLSVSSLLGKYEGTSDDPLYDMVIGRLLIKIQLFESDEQETASF